MRESVIDTANPVLSNLRDLPVSIDNINAAIIQRSSERFRCAHREHA
jgi:hypothetical protein